MRDQAPARSRNETYESCTLRAAGLAAAKIGQHAATDVSRSGDQVLRKRAQLHAVLAGQRRQRLGVEPLHLGQRKIGFHGAGMRDDGFELGLSSAFQAASDTMHSPVPLGLLKPG